MDVIMFIPNTFPILLHKKLGRGTQFKLSIPTLTKGSDDGRSIDAGAHAVAGKAENDDEAAGEEKKRRRADGDDAG